MYVIVIYPRGISVYQETDGQWDGSKCPPPFPSVIEAADWILSQGQQEVSIVNACPRAYYRAAYPDRTPEWFGCDREGITEKYRTSCER